MPLSHVNELHALMLGVISERFSTMGSQGAGLHEYYEHRLKIGQMFLMYDLPLVERLISEMPQVRTVVDIGAGVGQMSFLLAANGKHVVAVEATRERFETLHAIHRAVAYWNKDIAGRVTPVHARMPAELGIGKAGVVGLCALFVATISPETELDIIRSLRQFEAVVIDVARFGRMKRDTPELQAELIKLFAKEGFSDPTVLLDWKPGAYVIMRPI